jgi:hypothetical protein
MSASLKRKYKKRYTRTESISPDRARALLATMVENNRPVTLLRVKRYAKQMAREGVWKSTSQGLIIDWFGRLGNGMHRLLAVIESGVTIEVDVTYGEDPANFVIWDKGKERTLNDDMVIAEVVYPKDSAKLYRVYLDLQQTSPTKYIGFGHRKSVSHEDAIAWAQEHAASLTHVIERCRRKEWRRVLRPPATFMGLYYWLYERSPAEADSFFALLIDGSSGKREPVHQLRESLDQLMLDKMRGTTVPRFLYAALVFKAWNAHMARKTVKQIWFDPGLENFPDLTSRKRR